MIKYSFLIALVSVLLQAASFDCAKSISNIEKTICSYPHLDAMDEQLSQAYTNIKNSFSEEDKKILLNNQRVWLKKQKACETSERVEGCLKTLYEERIVFFNELAQNRFVRQNDVLTDRLMQMQWQDNFIVQNGHYDKKSKPGIKTWEEAKAYCENLTLDGKSDWRLPNITELQYADSIKKYFNHIADKSYISSSSGDDYYFDTYKNFYSDNLNSFPILFVGEPYIRCVRGETLQESANAILPKTPLDTNPFNLEMSQNDELCHFMEKIYNDDVQKDGMMHFDRHVEYNWLNWKKRIFKKENNSSRREYSFGIDYFDINNDGNVETVLFRRKYVREQMYDEVIYFFDDNKNDYASMTRDELFEKKIAKAFDTQGNYPLMNSSALAHIYGYILRPFKFKDQYYISVFGNSGKAPFEERSYSDIVITQLDTNNMFHDVCHFKRTLQDTSKQELDHNLKIFHSSASTKERLDALKMIIELGRYRDNPAVIYESCKKGLSDLDESIRSYAIRNIEINEKSIPLLLKTVINDPSDSNKISAIFYFGGHFTDNGADPSDYYYVIDEHIELAFQAYDALVEWDRRNNPNYNAMSTDMRNVMTSGMQFCDTKNYKNLDLIYERFKDKMNTFDKEAYEKCQSKSK